MMNEFAGTSCDACIFLKKNIIMHICILFWHIYALLLLQI